MILNLSYRKKETDRALLERAGKSFSFFERIKLGGIGSQRFEIIEADAEISEILSRDLKLNHCNIELRKGGVLIWFRIKLHNYALVLPYYLLTIFKGPDYLKVYGGKWSVKLKPAHNASFNTKFILKLMEQKNLNLSNQVI